MPQTPFRYYHNCTDWPQEDVETGLVPLQYVAWRITRAKFCKYVSREDLKALEVSLGYVRGRLSMSRDPLVTYHQARWHGRPCFFFRHSRIEYVFVRLPEPAEKEIIK